MSLYAIKSHSEAEKSISRKAEFDKNTGYKSIYGLVKRFDEQIRSYKKAEYNETLARQDFINPFFRALGWDVDNSNGNAEAYREVMHEDRIKVGNVLKAPDYSFKLPGGKRLFFVEAKKPSVFVKEEREPAFQVRSYAWSAKLSVSILTDFEEFAVYDCSIKPKETDKANIARISYITYNDYLAEFDFLWDTFSKEKVLKGSFDNFIQTNASKKGTTTVDKEFLLSLDEWRKQLALNIALRNHNLNEDELNFVVQQTIDRIIFLRIAEDRSLEMYGRLGDSVKEGDFYKNLFHYFQQSDKKYNSGLFDFRKDQISKNIQVDNKIIKSIVNELYYPLSPYVFTVLNVEILGNAYEQFLGKQIKLTAGHRATIEEKPEVRKAGGVYYTPEYIVEYIVTNTLGPFLQGKTPREIEAIKIADISCGSGSFLLGAYQYLLKWHLDYYTHKASKAEKKKMLMPDGNLCTDIKKRILINNIYGVDIDPQAVEVTKLSLLLRCMEGETPSSVSTQLSMFNERVLPSLDDNIKSGNSLIDADYYNGQIDFGEEKAIKPFNWKKAFPSVFANGGFTVIIGNPPYVRQEHLEKQKEYFQKKYKVFHGMADLYSYFIEKGIQLLSNSGLFGIIVANKWLRANYGEPLRKWLKEKSVKEISDFGDLPVFNGATAYPCILICGKGAPVKKVQVTNVKTLQFGSLQDYISDNKFFVEHGSLENNGWNLSSQNERKLLKKLNSTGIPLDKYVNGKVNRGVLTGLNEAFVIDSAIRNKLIKEDKKSEEIIKPFLAGRDVKRYSKPESNKYLIFSKRGIDIDKYPAIKKHLLQFRELLMPKPKDYKGNSWKGRKPGAYKWYEIQDAVDYYDEFNKPKIIYPNILKRPEFTLDTNNWFTNQKCFIISLDDKYLLGFLNSKLNHYLFEKYLPKLRGGFYEPSYVFFKKFPIKTIDVSDKTERRLQDDIIENVCQIMTLNTKLKKANLQSIKDQLLTRIGYFEEKIDDSIYKLYKLNNDEIKTIEAHCNQGGSVETIQEIKKAGQNTLSKGKSKIRNRTLSKIGSL
jgi:adenine-specific DNA-methyltransferase